MSDSFGEIIRRHARPLDPIQTDESSRLRKLHGIRAVMFDIYGTLLISASGDIEASDSTNHGQAFLAAMSAVGIPFVGSGEVGVQTLVNEIQAANTIARQEGNEFPEVDIVSIWGQVVSNLLDDNLTNGLGPKPAMLTTGVTSSMLKRLALEYEMRVNPVWPMPHALQCLNRLYDSGLCLGIISNAQFCTIEILKTLFHADSSGFEFDAKLQYYSFQHGRAKPGLDLYQFASESLKQRGIRGSEVLYIGNDMLKDVMPAAATGFRTALFAGDSRSLRRREGDSRVDDVTPDLVITDLMDVPKCIL
jgi:putative hydrolase of the HAD superfamily